MDTQASNPRPAAPLQADLATRRSNLPRWALLVVVGMVGIGLSLLLYRLLLAWEDRLVEVRFQRDAKTHVEAIRRAFADRVAAVPVLAAFYAGSQVVEREEFRTFVQPLLSEYPGIQALGWVPRVAESEREAHRQTAHLEGHHRYRITEWDSHDQLVPARSREEYFPVFFVEPREGNKTVLGFDLGSDEACLAALRRASETGRLAATEGVRFGEHRIEPCALFVVAPIYGKGRAADAPQQPEENLEGFVLGVLRIGEVVEHALDYLAPVGFDIRLFDKSPLLESPLLYAHPSRRRREPLVPLAAPPAETPATMHHQGSLRVGDRLWTVYCTPTELYVAEQRSWGPVGGLVAGLVLTGLLAGYLVLSTGRTARVEQLVNQRTAEFRAISNSALDAVIMMDPTGHVAHWNPAAERVFGYRREEIMGRHVHDTLVPERYRRRVEKGMREFAKHGRGLAVGEVLELEALRRDGSEFPIEIAVSSIRLKGQWWAVAIIRDITTRKRAEDALEQERQLLRKMLALQERERKLVAYEIHDGLAQQLAGALLKLQAFGRPQDHDPEEAQAACDEVKQLLSDSIDEARRLISGLRPPILDESGVVAAIDFLVCEQRQRGGPEVEFAHEVRFNRLARPLESAIFRVVQESLTNACRHSRSEKVRVELVQTNDCVRVEVQDWGIGFDPATVEQQRFGLQGVRERARLLGGRATVDSAPGRGTRIMVELPFVEKAPVGGVSEGDRGPVVV